MIIDKIHEGSFYRAKWLEIERAPDYQYERIFIHHSPEPCSPEPSLSPFFGGNRCSPRTTSSPRLSICT